MCNAVAIADRRMVWHHLPCCAAHFERIANLNLKKWAWCGFTKGKNMMSRGWESQQWHIWDGFVIDKEQIMFFKEPEEHVLPLPVL